MEKCTKIFESARNECGKVLSASLFNITWYIFAVSHQTVHDKSNKLKYCFMYNKHSEDLCYSTNIVWSMLMTVEKLKTLIKVWKWTSSKGYWMNKADRTTSHSTPASHSPLLLIHPHFSFTPASHSPFQISVNYTFIYITISNNMYDINIDIPYKSSFISDYIKCHFMY